MREVIEEVITRLKSKKTYYTDLSRDEEKRHNQTGASYFRGKAAGIRMAIEKLEGLLDDGAHDRSPISDTGETQAE